MSTEGSDKPPIVVKVADDASHIAKIHAENRGDHAVGKFAVSEVDHVQGAKRFTTAFGLASAEAQAMFLKCYEHDPETMRMLSMVLGDQKLGDTKLT